MTTDELASPQNFCSLMLEMVESMRQYKLVTHDDVPSDKIFKGEISRLNSYTRQRP